MNAPIFTDTIKTTAPTVLWRAAAAFMHLLYALFGDPADVAAQHTLTLKAHRVMASWLRCGEAMMRRLLAIEAAAFAKPNIRPLLRTPRKQTRKPITFTPDAPETWRVSFRCMDHRLPAGKPLPQPPKPRGRRRLVLRDHRPAPRPYVYRRRTNSVRYAPILRQDRVWIVHEDKPVFRPTRGLAARYEALLRAFNNPLAYARRLSRALHATPHRLRELLHAPPEARHRIEDFPAFTNAARQSWNTS